MRERIGIFGVFKRDNVIISTLKSWLQSIAWIAVTVLVVHSASDIFYRAWSFEEEIGVASVRWISENPSIVMEQGLFFSRAEDCFFTGYDPSGQLISGTTEPPSTLIWPYNQQELVLENGNRYIFTVQGSGIRVSIIITSLAILASLIIMIRHIHNVIRSNFNISTKFYAARNMLGDCIAELEELVSKKALTKRYFNLPMCIIVPLSIICVSCLAINLSIERHGRVITEIIANTIHHYGTIQSSELVDVIDDICKIDIKTIDISSWRPSEELDLTAENIEAIISAHSGYIMENKIARNYKLLDDDQVLGISIDMSEYFRIISSYILIAIVYSLYLILKIRENVFIE